MICEQCNNHEATIHMTQIVNNKKEEHHLCHECAQKAEHNKGFFEMFKVQSLFEDNFLKNDFFTAALYPQELRSKDMVKCEHCGMTFNDFNRTGRLGCNQCYDTFPEIKSLIKRVQGTLVYEGRVPKRGASIFYQARKIQALRNQLRELVSQEKYEEAVILRDEIKRLEQEIS